LWHTPFPSKSAQNLALRFRLSLFFGFIPMLVTCSGIGHERNAHRNQALAWIIHDLAGKKRKGALKD
jgi:hypothetical protein